MGGGGFFEFDEDTAESERPVEAGEPVNSAPVQTAVCGGRLEFVAVECATFPGVAGEESGDGVFCGEEEDDTAGAEDASEFAESVAGVGEIFQDVAAGDAVEAVIAEGEGAHIGRDEDGAGGVESFAGAAEHFPGEVKADDFAVGAGGGEEVSEDLSGAGADIENTIEAGGLEASGAKQAAHEGFVKRNQAAEFQHGPFGTIVEAADGFLVGAEGLATNSAKLAQPTQLLAGGPAEPLDAIFHVRQVLCWQAEGAGRRPLKFPIFALKRQQTAESEAVDWRESSAESGSWTVCGGVFGGIPPQPPPDNR